MKTENTELQISQRGLEMPQSPIRKLAPLAKTSSMTLSENKNKPVTGKTIMMASVVGFYTNRNLARTR